MDRLLKVLFQLNEFQLSTDDDFIDRLNRQFTPMILVMFTILVSVKQYVGEPMNCWCPAQFTESHMEYTNTVCWVSDTYYVPFDDRMPDATEPKMMISYYQWVPMMLLCQSFLFFVPSIFWHFLSKRSGMNISSVIEAGVACQRAIYSEAREKTVRYIVRQVDSYLITHRTYGKGWWAKVKTILAKYCCILFGKFSGNYLTCMYFVIKLLYIGNVVGQLFLLDAFLGMDSDYHFFGLLVLKRFLCGEDWAASHSFPRVTLCDFKIRQATNVHPYTVQCVLPINLFNEKIFVFIWFWFFFLTLATSSSFCHWIGKLLFSHFQVSYVKRQLKAMDFQRNDAKAIKRFTTQYLRRDGLFVINLLSKNAGDMLAAEVLHGLWINYGPNKRNLVEQSAEVTPHHSRRQHSTKEVV